MSVLNVRQSYSGGILLTFLAAGSVWLVMFLLFLYIRRKRAPVLNSAPASGDAGVRGGASFPHPLDYTSMFSWWLTVVRFPLAEVEAVCGGSAYAYLWFQQQWLKLFAVCSLGSLLVLLPLNIQGDLKAQVTHFDETTIAHIGGDSPALWIHVTFAVASAAGALTIARLWQTVWSVRIDADRRRAKLEQEERVQARKRELLRAQRRAALNYFGNNRRVLRNDNDDDNTDDDDDDDRRADVEALLVNVRESRFQDCSVMLTGLPKMIYSQLDALHSLLHYYYPDLVLLHPILDLRKLEALHRSLREARYELEYYYAEYRSSGVLPEKLLGSRLCCNAVSVPAIAHTEDAIRQLEQAVYESNDLAQDDLDSGVAFLTFASSAAALEFYYDISVRRQERHLFDCLLGCLPRQQRDRCLALFGAHIEHNDNSNNDSDDKKKNEHGTSSSLLASSSSSSSSGDDSDDNHHGNDAAAMEQPPISEAEADRQFQRFGVDRWVVERAPPPEEIFWPSLGMSPSEHRWRTWAVNAALVLVFVFWSSPAAIVSSLAHLASLFGADVDAAQQLLASKDSSSLLASFLLVLTMIVVPRLLMVSGRLEGHKTFAALEHSGMRKVYAFLLLATLVLPSFVSTSVTALVRVLVTQSWTQLAGEFASVFPNSSIFVCFALQVGFFGTGFDLLKLDYHVLYALRTRRVRSIQHMAEVRDAMQTRPPFGFWYATLMSMISVVLCYGAMVPQMFPAGLVWLSLRHMTDKHNIMYVHQRNVELHSSQVVRTASAFVFVAVGVALLGMFSVLVLIKHAAAPALFVILLLVPAFVFYCWLEFIGWPRLDDDRLEALFRDETPLKTDACDVYIHPVGKEHRRILADIIAQRNAAVEAAAHQDQARLPVDDDDDNDHIASIFPIHAEDSSSSD